MKRIKRILCVIVVLVSVLLLSACKKDYSAITYKRFSEKMKDELNYSVADRSLEYQDVYQRYYSAIRDDVLIIFYEFETVEDAKEYLKKNYSEQKYYSYKDYDDYSIVKSSKDGYFYTIQVDNTIISGSSDNKSDKSEIKKVFKELGY